MARGGVPDSVPPRRVRLRLAFVVQRYGLEVAGGAELHCRWVAEQLARRHQVEIFTTQALDHVGWTHGYPAGAANVNGIPVHRFAVVRAANPRQVASLSNRVFKLPHTREDEEAFVRALGPESPDLVAAVAAARERFDLFVFFSYRYYHSYFGLPGVREKAVLVPTAEEDDALGLGVYAELFRMPRAILLDLGLNPLKETPLMQRIGFIGASGLDGPWHGKEPARQGPPAGDHRAPQPRARGRPAGRRRHARRHAGRTRARAATSCSCASPARRRSKPR